MAESNAVEPELSEQQLRRYTGERGYRMYVAYAGVVYDLREIKEIGRRRGLELRAVATS